MKKISEKKYHICNDCDKILDEKIEIQLKSRQYSFKIKSSKMDRNIKYINNTRISFVGFAFLDEGEVLVSVPKGKNVETVDDKYLDLLKAIIEEYNTSELTEGSYKVISNHTEDQVVLFENVFEWLLSFYLNNQITVDEKSVYFQSNINSEKNEEGERIKCNLDTYKVYNIQKFKQTKNKYDIPDIVCDSKQSKLGQYCLIIDAKYHKKNQTQAGLYSKLEKIDIYKQFFYEDIIRAKYRDNIAQTINIANIFIVPMYDEDHCKENINYLDSIHFNYSSRDIHILAINIDELMFFKKNKDEDIRKKQNNNRVSIINTIKKYYDSAK